MPNTINGTTIMQANQLNPINSINQLSQLNGVPILNGELNGEASEGVSLVKKTKKKSKIQVSPERALEIFEDLMSPSIDWRKVEQYIDEKIDFNSLIRLIPIEKLKHSYPVASKVPLTGDNTFLNKLIGRHLGDLPKHINLDTMDYLARNSNAGEHCSLYLYFYITSIKRNSRNCARFSVSTIDYLIEHTEPYIEVPSEFLKKINLKTRSDYSLLGLCLMAVCAKMQACDYSNKTYRNYINKKQIKKILDKTSSAAIQKSQYVISWALLDLIGDRYNVFNEQMLSTLINNLSLSTQEKRLEFMEAGICLLNEVEADRPGEAIMCRELLKRIETIHNFDWREVVLQNEPTRPFLINQRNGMFTQRVLEEIIYYKETGQNEKYREQFLKKDRALPKLVLQEYDISRSIAQERNTIMGSIMGSFYGTQKEPQKEKNEHNSLAATPQKIKYKI